MQVQGIARVIERLEAAMRDVANPVLATDADGTLWSGDVGIDTFESMIEGRELREESLAALRSETEQVGLEPSSDVIDMASRLHQAALVDAYSEARCYEMMAWVFAGYTVEQAKEIGRRVGRLKGLRDRLHDEMRPILAWATQRGVTLKVVSASPLPVVQAGVELLGIDPACVIAAEAAQRDGIILPKMRQGLPYGPSKVTSLRRVCEGATVIGAFGDNAFDIEMLRIAQVPVAVRPKARLLDRQADVPGLVQLQY